MFCARMTKRYPAAKKFREGRSNLGRRHKSRCGRRPLQLLAARRCGSQHPALLVVNPTPNTAWSRHMEHHARWRQCRKTSPSSRMATDSTPTTWTSLDGCLQESIAILSGHQTLEDASTAENEIAGLRIGNLQSDRRSKHPQPADEIPENQRATTAPHPPAFQRYLQPSNERSERHPHRQTSHSTSSSRVAPPLCRHSRHWRLVGALFRCLLRQSPLSLPLLCSLGSEIVPNAEDRDEAHQKSDEGNGLENDRQGRRSTASHSLTS